MLLDLNRLAEGHSFLGLGAFDVSNDNQLLAYALDTTGFRQYTLHIKNLWNGAIFPEAIERVTSAVWAADNRTIFYTLEDATTKRSYRLYRHSAGSAEPDTLIYEETDERFRIEIERTRSGAFLLLVITIHTTSEVRFLPAGQPSGEFRIFFLDWDISHDLGCVDIEHGQLAQLGQVEHQVTAAASQHRVGDWSIQLPFDLGAF